tara:strand:+ start:372 stop:707 length:336 start_codon:yes stop_codon:yes gene_type:complete
MTQEQIIHVGMINSFNLITERNTLEEIATPDLSLFAHVPDEEIPLDLIQLMMDYFQSFDMFEYCIDLVQYIALNYNEDGTRIQDGCECSQPTIKEYSKKMHCGTCSKRLKK